MEVLSLASVLGGIVAGFMAGASSEPVGGNTAAAIAAMVLGVIGFGVDPRPSALSAEIIGALFLMFLFPLIATYILANIARHHGKLRWMGIG
jgi:hypothetical protein